MKYKLQTDDDKNFIFTKKGRQVVWINKEFCTLERAEEILANFNNHFLPSFFALEPKK